MCTSPDARGVHASGAFYFVNTHTHPPRFLVLFLPQRFGKFTQLEFEGGMQLAGGTVQSYLLEQSRVVFQVANEGNFHVFYHLFQDSELDSSTWNLNAKETYHYINQSGIIDVPGIIDDKAGENGIDEVYKSLTQINDDDVEYIQEVYNCIAAILWLGNLDFEGAEDAKPKGAPSPPTRDGRW